MNNRLDTFINTQEMIRKIASKSSVQHAIEVENWLRKHWEHKPGPSIIHIMPEMSLMGKCHGCKEIYDFKFKVQSLDQF